MLDLLQDPSKKKRIPIRFKEYALKQLKEREYNKRRLWQKQTKQ